MLELKYTEPALQLFDQVKALAVMMCMTMQAVHLLIN